MNHESDSNYDWNVGKSTHLLGKGVGKVENRMTKRDHFDYFITEISQNTVKGRGGLSRIAVIQTSVKGYQKKKKTTKKQKQKTNKKR